jgi:integral membrane protein
VNDIENSWSQPLRTLRMASWAEGATLLLLLLVAVPLKHVAHMPVAVSLMGPIHGTAFLIYAFLVLKNLGAKRLDAAEAILLLTAAFIPFGAFLVGSVFRRKSAAA